MPLPKPVEYRAKGLYDSHVGCRRNEILHENRCLISPEERKCFFTPSIQHGCQLQTIHIISSWSRIQLPSLPTLTFMVGGGGGGGGGRGDCNWYKKPIICINSYFNYFLYPGIGMLFLPQWHLFKQSFCTVHYFRFANIYSSMASSFQSVDVASDLSWWSQNLGTGTPVQWPEFEVWIYTIIKVKRFIKYMMKVAGWHALSTSNFFPYKSLYYFCDSNLPPNYILMLQNWL